MLRRRLGAGLSEHFTGTMGSVTLSADRIDIVSDQTRDSAVISVTTGMTLPTGLAVTGYGQPHDRRRSVEAGFVALSSVSAVVAISRRKEEGRLASAINCKMG